MTFAKVGLWDAQLFMTLARVAEQCLAKFHAQGLTNMAWAFATVGHSDAQLFMALARVAEWCIDDFNE